jgi:acyl-coenzyme A synthetase/AMP-(fatty) acid ligase
VIRAPGTGGDQVSAYFVKQRLAAHAYPRSVEFVNDLPMTTTDKIIHRVLCSHDTLRQH